MAVSLTSEKSHVPNPGPRSKPLGALPREPHRKTGDAGTPGHWTCGCIENIAGLNHCSGLPVYTVLGSNGTGA
jgi:hypothetical protein